MSGEYQKFLNTMGKLETNVTVNGVKVIKRSSVIYDGQIKQALDQIYLERFLSEGNCMVCRNKTSKFCLNCGAHYCCLNCQIADWPTHQLICGTTIKSFSSTKGSYLWSSDPNDSGNACKKVVNTAASDKKKNDAAPKKAPEQSSQVNENAVEDVNTSAGPEKRGSATQTAIKADKSVSTKTNSANIEKPAAAINDIGSKEGAKSGKGEVAAVPQVKQEDGKSDELSETDENTEWAVVRSNDSIALGDVIEVVCLEWERKGYCWVMLQENFPLFKRMQKFLSANYEKYPSMDPAGKDLFMIRYNGEWCRATLAGSETKIIIQCLDLGVKFTPRYLRCRELDPEIAAVERLAFQVHVLGQLLPGTDKREKMVVEVFGMGKHGALDVKLTTKTPALVNDTKKALKEKSPKKRKRVRSVLDCVKPGMCGLFMIMGMETQRQVYGCLIPEELEDAKYSYRRIRTLYCAAGEEIEADVGDAVMIADSENMGMRAIVEAKTEDNKYNVSLTDYGYTTTTANIYQLPEGTLNLMELGCKLSVIPIDDELLDLQFQVDVNVHYFFVIKRKLTEGKWLCSLKLEPYSNDELSEAIIEKARENFYDRLSYIPFPSGCKVIISNVCTDCNEACVYVRRVDENWEERFRSLNLKVNNFPLVADKFGWGLIELGDIVRAKYDNSGTWRRGKVLSRERDGAKVFFLDSGNEKFVQPSDVTCLSLDLRNEPVLAMKVPLKGSKGPIEAEGLRHLRSIAEESRELIMRYEGNISEGVVLTDNAGTEINKTLFDTKSSKFKDAFTENFMRNSSFPEGPVEKFLVLYVDEEDFMENGVFWAADSSSKNFNFIIAELGCQLRNYSKTNTNGYTPQIGELCIALYEDDWYRGFVLQRYGNDFEIFFVDFGNTSLVSTSSIREMLPKFFEKPPTAVKCILNGHERLARTHRRKTFAYLQEKVNDRVGAVNILKVTEDGCYADLPEVFE